MQLEEAVAAFMAGSPSCTLCRAPAVIGAVFIPDAPEEWFNQAPRAGRTRLALYALCQACFDLPEEVRLERVDGVLAASKDVPVLDVGMGGL